MRDVNLELAGLLLDMAALSGKSQRTWGYKRAAKAGRAATRQASTGRTVRFCGPSLLRVDRHVTPLIESNTFRAVPGIGPTTDRIARELVHDGRPPLSSGRFRKPIRQTR